MSKNKKVFNPKKVEGETPAAKPVKQPTVEAKDAKPEVKAPVEASAPVEEKTPVVEATKAAPVVEPEIPVQTEVIEPEKKEEPVKPKAKPEPAKTQKQPKDEKKPAVTLASMRPQAPTGILVNNSVLDFQSTTQFMTLVQKEYLGDKNDPLYKTYKPQFDYMVAFQCAMYNQQFKEAGKVFGIEVNTDIIQGITDQFADFGITIPTRALSAGASDGQTLINFKEVQVDKEVEEMVKRESVVAKEEVAPELDAAKISTVEEIQAALLYLLTRTAGKAADNINNAIEKMREIRKFQEADAAKKETWDKILPGAILTDIFNVVQLPSSIINGLANAVYNTAKMDKTAISTHCVVHKHFPFMGDDEIASIVRAILEHKAQGPVDKDPAITGLVSDTKDAFDAFYTKETDLGKKVMGMLGANYGAEFQGKPNSELLAKNLMVNLANLYLTDGAKLAAYVEKGYPVDPEKKN